MEVLDRIITPGLVELHAHAREPGICKAETIASATRSAMLGGYVLLGDMPNNPGYPTWYLDRMLQKHDIAGATAYIPYTAHAGSQPEEDNVGQLALMSQISLWLKLYGAPTTGTHRDYEASEFRERVAIWHDYAPDKPIGFHAGKHNLEDMIGMVAGDFGHHLHVHHVNSSKDVQLVKKAQARNWPVTCGICPHHMIKTSHDVRSEGWFARVQPDLVDQDQAERLTRDLANNYIDIIETDHAPWPVGPDVEGNSKFKAELENPDGIHDQNHSTCFGFPGIEFAAPLLFYMANRGYITMDRVIDAMSTRPAEILGIKLSSRTKVEWDMREYRIGEDDIQSQAGWTPYGGKLALGKVASVSIGAKQLVEAGNIIDRDARVITRRGEII